MDDRPFQYFVECVIKQILFTIGYFLSAFPNNFPGFPHHYLIDKEKRTTNQKLQKVSSSHFEIDRNASQLFVLVVSFHNGVQYFEICEWNHNCIQYCVNTDKQNKEFSVEVELINYFVESFAFQHENRNHC